MADIHSLVAPAGSVDQILTSYQNGEIDPNQTAHAIDFLADRSVPSASSVLQGLSHPDPVLTWLERAKTPSVCADCHDPNCIGRSEFEDCENIGDWRQDLRDISRRYA